MKRIELAALCAHDLRWEQLTENLPAAFESIGLAHDDKATDGEAQVIDRGSEGCVVLMGNVALARRAARALAVKAGATVQLFEVVGSAGKRFRFQTTAWKATAGGDFQPSEGVELDLDDPEENWGGGPLEVQANRVLDLFAQISRATNRDLKLGYKRRARPKASTPRIATLLTSLQKAKGHASQVQPDGRVALRIELATGGTQTSFCTAAEHAELEQLLERI